MGPLPRTHGLLGAMLESPEPYRIDDIHTDPRFRGWWPSAHPDMRSFLGVPVVARGRVIGAVYLTDKQGAPSFSDEDERLIGLLAAHAAIAIENARLYERSRELSIVEERNRLARELHDSVIQRLFGVSLAIESAGTLLERDPAAAAAEVERVQRALARGDGGAARGGVRAAPRLARGGGAGERAAQARRRAAPRLGVADRADARRPAAAGGRADGAGVPDRAGGAPERAAPRRRRAHRGAARERRRGARAERGRRRLRLRPDRARGARAPARADLDGGARGGARRDARRSSRWWARGRRCGSRSPA